MKAHVHITVVALVLCWLAGCAGRVGAPLPPRLLSHSSLAAMAVGRGDRISVHVFGEETLTGEFRVDDEGCIDYPYLGRIRVGQLQVRDIAEVIRHGLSDEPSRPSHVNEQCLTDAQLSANSAERYGANVLRRPNVSVSLSEVVSRPISVLGQVQHPGVLQYTTRMTLAQAITQSGGFTALAAKGQVRVTRHFSAIMAASGGDAQNATDRSTTYVLDVDRILDGRAPDFDLQPYDVIYVPESIA